MRKELKIIASLEVLALIMVFVAMISLTNRISTLEQKVQASSSTEDVETEDVETEDVETEVVEAKDVETEDMLEITVMAR